MFKKLKNLFCQKQRIEPAKHKKIYKSLNSATILVHIMLDPDNLMIDLDNPNRNCSNKQSNNNDKNKILKNKNDNKNISQKKQTISN